MAKATLSGRMAEDIRVSMSIIKNKAMVNLHGLMAGVIRGSGRMGNKMVVGCLREKMVFRGLGSGVMARRSSG